MSIIKQFKPRKKDSLVLRKAGDTLYAYDYETNRVYEFRGIMSTALCLFDGKHSVEKIIKKTSENHNTSVSETEDTLTDFVLTLKREGLLVKEKGRKRNRSE